MKKYCNAVFTVFLVFFFIAGCDNGDGEADADGDADAPDSEAVDMEVEEGLDGNVQDAFDVDAEDIEEDEDGGQECEIPGNLLSNPGFENGDDGPFDWVVFPETSPGGIIFDWDDALSHGGTRSVSVEISSPAEFGMWRQVVPALPGTVYVLTGYVKFENVSEAGRCNLQVVFWNAAGEVAKFIDYPSHTGTRDFAYDFPVRARRCV